MKAFDLRNEKKNLTSLVGPKYLYTSIFFGRSREPHQVLGKGSTNSISPTPVSSYGSSPIICATFKSKVLGRQEQLSYLVLGLHNITTLMEENLTISIKITDACAI